MIFSVQRYVEDYLERRGLVDNDDYAVKVANLYANEGHTSSEARFQKRLSTIHTMLFRANPSLVRKEFQAELLQAIHRRFSKKKEDHAPPMKSRSLVG